VSSVVIPTECKFNRITSYRFLFYLFIVIVISFFICADVIMTILVVPLLATLREL